MPLVWIWKPFVSPIICELNKAMPCYIYSCSLTLVTLHDTHNMYISSCGLRRKRNCLVSENEILQCTILFLSLPYCQSASQLKSTQIIKNSSQKSEKITWQFTDANNFCTRTSEWKVYPKIKERIRLILACQPGHFTKNTRIHFGLESSSGLVFWYT